MTRPILLGVNIDHIATVRQARGTLYPDPIEAALEAEAAGADGITLHLREDRRHIQDRDVEKMKGLLQTRMNLELALTNEMLEIARKVKPEHCCPVPESREELTTEGGLDVRGLLSHVTDCVKQLTDIGSEVSLFIDPDEDQIRAAKQSGAPSIELHTGAYADAKDPQHKKLELIRVIKASQFAESIGLQVNAGHGLNIHNVKAVAAIPEINELNIGHAIVARALFIGMQGAVREMKQLMLEAREGGEPFDYL